MRFTLRQLEVFVAVGRVESISLAMEGLSLSQSATSTALSELEKQFGHPLFDRIGKGLRLNDIGRRLLPNAVDLLDRAKEIEYLLTDQASMSDLKIGATLTIGNYLATLMVAQFLREYPQSRIDLKVKNTVQITQSLLQFELDFGLIEGSCWHPELLVEPWLQDELVVFCAPSHPLAKQNPVSLEELQQAEWIVREQGSGTRDLFDRILGEQNFFPQIRLELEHTEAIKRAVESGLGIGCLSQLALKEAFRRESLIELATPFRFQRQFHLVWHRRKFHSKSMEIFLNQCRQLQSQAVNTASLELPFIP